MSRRGLIALVAVVGCGEHRGGSADTGLPPAGTDAGPTAGTSSGPGGDTTTPQGPVVLDVAAPDAGPGDAPTIPETCASAARVPTSVGCEFYAVELDRLDDIEGDGVVFGISVSNVQAMHDATITLERHNGILWEVVEGPVTLEPFEVVTMTPPANMQTGSGVRDGGSYRITADRPVSAYQFSPLETDVDAYSSDASMLYPVASWGDVYKVINWGGVCNPLDGEDERRAYVTVVAADNGTEVRIEPSVDTAAGPGIVAAAAGTPVTVTLDAGDILEVAAAQWGASMSGTRVTSPGGEPLGVFSGHRCGNVPEGTAACDHLEEQLAPLSQWGTRFVAMRPAVRWWVPPDPVQWVVQAGPAGANVEIEGPAGLDDLPTGAHALGSHETYEFIVEPSTLDAAGDFAIASDQPIAVAVLMTGSAYGDCPLFTLPQFDLLYGGDPAMVVLSPVAQYLHRNVVLVPEHVDQTYLAIARAVGTGVWLDGAALADEVFTPVDADYEVARVEVSHGVHLVEGNAPIQAVVWAFDEYDSYGYLGGVGAAIINPAG